jgi:phosphatidate cytidylyltransferase
VQTPFTARLATALVLLAGCIAALFVLPGWLWAILLLAVLAMAAWEWAALAGLGNALRMGYALVIVASAVAIGLAIAAGVGRSGLIETAVYGTSCLFWLAIVLPWLVFGGKAQSPLVLGLAGWLVLVPAWLALSRLQAQPAVVLALLGIVWIADSCAYFAGRAWGRHRLAPSISPAKTWEGVAGAAAGVAVYYAALYHLVPEWRWWHGWGGALLVAGVGLLSVVGDLFESWVKRLAGAKDSGALLPGHGGILDRIDSITSSMPFAALLLLHVR